MTSGEDLHKAILDLVRNAPPVPLIKLETPEPQRIQPPRLRDFIFSFRTLELQLRVLTVTVLAEVFAAIFLIAARDHLVPVLNVDALNGDAFSIPWPSYAMAGVAVIVGICLLTRGTVDANPRGRLYFVGILFAFFLAVSIFTAPTGQKEMIAASSAAIAYCAFCGVVVQFFKARLDGHRQGKAVGWALLPVFTAPAIYALLKQPLWFTLSMLMLVLPLIYIFMLAGTDWAEMVDATALTVLNAAFGRWLSIWLALLGIAFCGFFAQFMKVMSVGAAWTYVPAVLIPILPMFLLLRFVRADTWHPHISWGGLAIVTSVFGICIASTARLGTNPTPIWVFWPLLYALVAAILMILFARRPKLVEYCPLMLFAVILGLFATVLRIAGPPKMEWVSLDGAMQGIALGSIYGILYLLYVGWMKSKDVRVPIFYTILLNVGCFSLYMLSVGLYASMRRAGGGKALIEAAVLFTAIVWDVLLSGHSITNVNGKLFPRRSRIFLFLGYLLLVAATVVFWNSVKTGPGDFRDYVELARDPDFLVQLGIALYGPTILLTLFALRLASWVRSVRPEDEADMLVRRLESLPFHNAELPNRR